MTFFSVTGSIRVASRTDGMRVVVDIIGVQLRESWVGEPVDICGIEEQGQMWYKNLSVSHSAWRRNYEGSEKETMVEV